jgi:hypothetical protein
LLLQILKHAAHKYGIRLYEKPPFPPGSPEDARSQAAFLTMICDLDNNAVELVSVLLVPAFNLPDSDLPRSIRDYNERRDRLLTRQEHLASNLDTLIE